MSRLSFYFIFVLILSPLAMSQNLATFHGVSVFSNASQPGDSTGWRYVYNRQSRITWGLGSSLTTSNRAGGYSLVGALTEATYEEPLLEGSNVLNLSLFVQSNFNLGPLGYWFAVGLDQSFVQHESWEGVYMVAPDEQHFEGTSQIDKYTHTGIYLGLGLDLLHLGPVYGSFFVNAYGADADRALFSTAGLMVSVDF